MSHSARLAILDDFSRRVERDAVARFRSRGLPAAPTVGSWRDDAEVEPTKLTEPDALTLVNGTRIYPRFLDRRNEWLHPDDNS